MLVKYLLLLSFPIIQTWGHGMLLDPPNRSSLWRFYKSAPANYDDNQNYCGGFGVQWLNFGGKCGVCGDKFNDTHPQANENRGLYGQGKVVRQYKMGSVIVVTVLLTKNHFGKFTYSLCVLKDFNSPEPGENCFKPLKLSNGLLEYQVSANKRKVKNKIKLPDIKCSRCVLRWQYTAGNNWGDCKNGTEGLGCGPQETFRSCSDISIL